MGFSFNKDSVYNKIIDTGIIRDGNRVDLIEGTGAVTVKKLSSGGDMYSHPYPQYAADTRLPDTAVFQDFIQALLRLKTEEGVSYGLRSYILRLIVDPDLLAQFVDDPDEALKYVPIEEYEKQMLKDVVADLSARAEGFRSDQVIDDNDHFLLFPQTLEAIAPRAWFDAAWPFIERFRSNFGFYLGEALLYSQVTILGSTDVVPAVSEGQETYLKRIDWRAVERIGVTSAKDLKRVLTWGVEHEVYFGLGRVSDLILQGAGDDEVMAELKQPAS